MASPRKPLKKQKEKKAEKKRRISLKFASILAIVSIIGFLDIILNSFFEISFQGYMDFLWLVIMGVGFILISNPKRLPEFKTEEPVSDITALVIGILAIIAGILSLPFLNIIHPVFLAIKGVISLIAIIFIALETWVIQQN